MSSVTKCFADRLGDLISESGKPVKILAKEIGISTGALSKYQNDAAVAGVDALAKIAKYFDVSSDWLLGISDFPRKVDEYIPASEVGLTANSIYGLMADRAFAEVNPRCAHIIDGINMLLPECGFHLLSWDIYELSKSIERATEYEEKTEYDGCPIFRDDLPGARILMGFDGCEHDFLHIKEEFADLIEKITGYDKLKDFVAEKRNQLEKSYHFNTQPDDACEDR